MHSRILAIAILALVNGSAIAAMSAATPTKWQQLVVPGAGLAVDMPGEATKVDDLTIEGMRSVGYRLETGEIRAYSVRAEQMPAGQIATQGGDALFNNIRDGMLADGTLREERPLQSEEGVIGRGIIIDGAVTSGPDAYTLVAHLYLRGDWLYQLIATVPRGGEQDPVARRFLASARFLGK